MRAAEKQPAAANGKAVRREVEEEAAAQVWFAESIASSAKQVHRAGSVQRMPRAPGRNPCPPANAPPLSQRPAS